MLVDLEGSTRLPPARLKAATRILQKELASLSGRHRADLLLPLRQQYGDEIAALLRTPRAVYEIVDAVRHAVRPYTGVRYVVTQGRIGQAAGEISLVGGPVFKEAEQLMRVLKKRRAPASIWQIGEPVQRSVLQALADMSDSLIEDLTDFRYSIWRNLREGKSQSQVAGSMKRHAQSISNAVAAGHLRALILGEKAMSAVLGSIESKSIDSTVLNQK